MMSDESAEFDGMKTQKERILAREAACRCGETCVEPGKQGCRRFHWVERRLDEV